MNLAIAYKIRCSDGRIDHAGDLEEAHQILIERYGKEVVYCDNGEAVPYPYEREIDNAGRILVLVWASKLDSENDSGQMAIAEIVED